MNLLNRVAQSNGDPERTIAALRLINQQLEQELQIYRTQLDGGSKGRAPAASPDHLGQRNGHSIYPVMAVSSTSKRLLSRLSRYLVRLKRLD